MSEGAGVAIIVVLIITLIVGFIGGILWLGPVYRVWRMEMNGKASLAEAQWSKKIAIEEALAKKDSAQHLADAEIVRAEGVAKANKIIGESLQNNEAYLRYLWVQGLQDGKSDVIYVPTEANLPILEAGRHIKLAQQ